MRDAPSHSLPSNVEAEMALLGAILFDNALLDRLPDLRPDHFYDPLNGIILGWIKAGRHAGKAVVDTISLKPQCAADPAFAEVGGEWYLTRLLERAARLEGHATEYAHLIKDAWSRRMLVAWAREIEGLALSPPEGADAADIVEEAARELALMDVAAGTTILTMKDAGRLVLEDLRAPAPAIIKTGIPSLDNLMGGGMEGGDLIIVGGRPGMGKTALADNIAVNVAMSDVVDLNGKPIRNRVVAYFSMEMMATQLARRGLSRLNFGDPQAFTHGDLRNPDRRPSPERVAPYVERLPATLAIHERGGLSVAQISKGAKDTRRHFGALDAIVVDYLQLMSEAKVRSKDGRTQELTAITMGLKSLAKELRVPVIALSQLSRQLEAREDKRPLLSDLRESGSIEQDADVVMFVYREHYYLKQSEPKPRDGESSDEFQTRHLRWRGRMLQTERTCEVIVPKGRHGGTGTCTLEAHLGFDFITEPTNQPQDPANNGAPRQAYWMDADA